MEQSGQLVRPITSRSRGSNPALAIGFETSESRGESICSNFKDRGTLSAARWFWRLVDARICADPDDDRLIASEMAAQAAIIAGGGAKRAMRLRDCDTRAG